jgi:hypothetical protein
MPNIDNPHGLHCLGRTLSGGQLRFQSFDKAVGYATRIFPGDAVNRVADGTIEVSATPGTTNYSGVALNGGAASTLTSHLVCVSPDALYEAQDEGTGVAAADLGLLANLVLNAGVAATNKSGHEINGATKAVTATLDVALLELLPEVGNEYGANARVVVKFNKHRMNPGVAGV